MIPKINVINKKNIRKRENIFDEDYSESFEDYIEDFIEEYSNENKICEIQNLSDLTKIKRPIESLTDELDLISPYFGNEYYLFTQNKEIKIKKMENYIDNYFFETDFGLMMTRDMGEFGGGLYNLTKNGLEKVEYGNFSYVFGYNHKVYAITSLAHLSFVKCSLYEIKKFKDKYETILIFENEEMTMDCCYSDEKYLYFFSDPYNKYSGLFRLNLDNYHLELICKDILGSININSIIKQNSIIYLYGNYNLMKYNLKTDEIEYYTNLKQDEISALYVDDKKLIDLWNEYLF